MRAVYGAQRKPAASQNHRLAHSPTDALIDLPVSCPVGLYRNSLTDMRIAVIPQRWPARQGYV